jgi:hypothetical protein
MRVMSRFATVFMGMATLAGSGGAEASSGGLAFPFPRGSAPPSHGDDLVALLLSAGGMI